MERKKLIISKKELKSLLRTKRTKEKQGIFLDVYVDEDTSELFLNDDDSFQRCINGYKPKQKKGNEILLKPRVDILNSIEEWIDNLISDIFVYDHYYEIEKYFEFKFIK